MRWSRLVRGSPFLSPTHHAGGISNLGRFFLLFPDVAGRDKHVSLPCGYVYVSRFITRHVREVCTTSKYVKLYQYLDTYFSLEILPGSFTVWTAGKHVPPLLELELTVINDNRIDGCCPFHPKLLIVGEEDANYTCTLLERRSWICASIGSGSSRTSTAAPKYLYCFFPRVLPSSLCLILLL